MNCCRQCGQIAEYEGIAGAPPSPNGVRVRAYISSLTSHFLQAVTCLSTDSQTQTPAALILVISVDTHSQEVTLHAAQIASSPAIACCVKTETTAWPLGLLPSHPETARTPHKSWHLASMRSAAEKNKAAATSQRPAIHCESAAPLGWLGQFGLPASLRKRYGFGLGTHVHGWILPMTDPAWDLAVARRRIEQLETALMRRTELLEQKQAEVAAIRSSKAFRAASLANKLLDRLFPLHTRRRTWLKATTRRLGSVPAAIWSKRNSKKGPPPDERHLSECTPPDEYRRWIAKHEPNDAELKRQRSHRWSRSPKFSVVVPV